MARALEKRAQASMIYPNNVLRRNNVALFAMYGGEFDVAEVATGVLGLNRTSSRRFSSWPWRNGAGRPAEVEARGSDFRGVSAVGRDLAARARTDLAMPRAGWRTITDHQGGAGHAVEGRTPLTTARLATTLAEVRELQGRDADAVSLPRSAEAKQSPGIALFAES
jgi:hypothetical protein